MADKKIYIKISMEDGISGSSTNQNNVESQNKSEVKKAGESNDTPFSDVVTAMLIDNAKKVLNNSISQYSNLTGDSVNATRLQAYNTITSYGLAIAAAGWVGAVGVAVDIGLQVANTAIERTKANNQVALLRQRVGYSTMNGSRDTNG